MAKKKDEIFIFKLLAVITFNAVNEPNKYDPLSPKNICALGKLKSKKLNKIIIWAVTSIANLS